MNFFRAGLAFWLIVAVTAWGEEEYRARAHTQAFFNTTTSSDVEAEVEFGREVAARILGKTKLYDNPKVLEYVNLVGNSVAMYASRPELLFHFAVVDSDQLNAYAAPGGYIFITTGALKLMQDEAELAAVLAHEIAHVTQKHIVKALDIKGGDQDATAGVSRFLGGSGDAARVAFAQAVGKAMELLFVEGVQKEDEFEADEVGLTFLIATGYDPAAMIRYLTRVKNAKGGQLSVVYKTHPPFEERLARLDTIYKNERMAEVKLPAAKERFTQNVRF